MNTTCFTKALPISPLQVSPMSKCHVQIPTTIATSFLKTIGCSKGYRLMLESDFLKKSNQIKLLVGRIFDIYLILNMSGKMLRRRHFNNFMTRVLTNINVYYC